MTENHLHLFQEPDHTSIDEIRELELSDADILDAMREIPAISTLRRRTSEPSITSPMPMPSSV
jgi:hypothetical protein